MKKSRLLGAVCACFSIFYAANAAQAAVVTSIGSGTAVSSADHIATFDSLIGNSISLNGYTEDGLVVSVNDTQCCFDGRHYGDGGNNSFVSISTSDGTDFIGLELDFGTGFNDGLHDVVWETKRDGVTTGSGILTGIFASNGLINGFSVLGWSDTNLFDTLLIGAAPVSQNYNAFGQFQAIALDNVKIDFTAAVPVPAAIWLFGSGLLGLVGIARRKKA